MTTTTHRRIGLLAILVTIAALAAIASMVWLTSGTSIDTGATAIEYGLIAG